MASTSIGLAPREVLADLAPNAAVRRYLLVVAGAGLVGLLAQLVVRLPFTPVPITGQTLGVLLVGTSLGGRKALASLSLYALAGLAGVPWFAESTAGWESASFGYVIGFVLAAGLCGALARRGSGRSIAWTAVAMALATIVIYACGTLWLYAVTGVPASRLMALGVTPFVVGDLTKAAIASAFLPAVWNLVQRWMPESE